eukprot:TRINITY_DN1270_c3_g1_i2.p1 TRINITY_DN1270_c3_g1~~TRINITY_DN1270_c3_g1_i2.p1  ORF type:complete len:334 (-),score=32.98 TRINITY_DN1270_c3_g1_i2:91-996(-)
MEVESARSISVTVDATTLPKWSNATSPPLKTHTGRPPQNPSPFRFQPDLNNKIVLWRGDICSLINVDAIVHSTNEAMTERTEVGKRIFAAAGRELQATVSRLEGCKTGEARLTSGCDLPVKHIIHTVGPRFNEKYKIAAENALHNCYRNCLQTLTENQNQSLAFTVINSEKRGYPPENGAHIALRTVRRFLERYNNLVTLVVFCADSDAEHELYEKIAWMYFPRSKGEEAAAARVLPEDTGNETGETVVEERKIRIADSPLTLGEVEDGHLFRSLTEMKDHPDKGRLAPPKQPEASFCSLF